MAGSTQTEIPSQLGKTVVATGATGGLGYETALTLAKAGSEVIAEVSYEHLDLASLASIADFARRMHARQSLDVLINNAGVMALPSRQTTADALRCSLAQTIWVTLR